MQLIRSPVCIISPCSWLPRDASSIMTYLDRFPIHKKKQWRINWVFRSSLWRILFVTLIWDRERYMHLKIHSSFLTLAGFSEHSHTVLVSVLKSAFLVKSRYAFKWFCKNPKMWKGGLFDILKKIKSLAQPWPCNSCTYTFFPMPVCTELLLSMTCFFLWLPSIFLCLHYW